MSFKAPYLSKDDLRRRAADFLVEHNSDRHIPVPIEQIVETKFGMDIVPVPGIQSAFDVVAFVTKDLQEIRVDEYVYLNRLNRYRFSLAHELAHRILHADLWQTIKFQDVQTWKAVITGSIPEDQYGYIEFHADFFAGLVLVPEPELRKTFSECIELARKHGVDVSDESTGRQEIIEANIARQFEVSRDVVHRRLEADGLWADLT